MYTATIIQEDDMYVATCLEYDITSQWSSIEESMDNLREAMELYFQTTQSLEQSIIKPSSVFVTNFTLPSSSHASYSVA